MRARLALATVLALAGCGDLFTLDHATEGYACSATGTCPPGQQCVPSEHICRTPCTQTSLNPGGMTGPNGQCSGLNDGQSSTGYSCDYDHFCRPRCSNTSGTCGGCSGTDVCDETVDVCRPACSAGACPSTWGCVDLSNAANNGGTPSICAGCRPLATATFLAPTFAPVVFYPGLSTQTDRAAVGDLAGDGHPDVITWDGVSKHLYVFANDGTGALMPAVAYPVAISPFDAVVVDMNRDGKADVVVATADNAQGGPVLYPGNGDHTLGTPVVGPNLPTTRLTVGDFDGDGKPDVAGCGSGTGQMSVLTADGAGGLKQLSAFNGGPGDSFVRLGAMDFNGDKHLDLWGDDQHATVREFLSNGSATSLGFSESTSVNGPGPRFDSITADIDGDGKLDFVWVQENGSGSPTMPSNIIIEHDAGGGMFTNPSPSMQATLPASGYLAAADFDGDGHVDVAMVEALAGGKSNVDILCGDGKKLTWSEQIAITKGAPQSIAAADLDGDGKPDLVVSLGGGGVAVLINQTTPASH